MQPSVRQSLTELERLLLETQSADGGWPYYPGKASRIEPTAWAILALGISSPGARPAAEKARAFLRGLQQSSGLLLEPGGPTPNHTWNGLALLADTSSEPVGESKWTTALVDGLLAVRGVALDDDSSVLRQNSRLRAWSWIDGTFSWIEPTATCMLALKKAKTAGSLARIRLSEAEAVILDRVCDGGGWNYGNAAVLGQDLRPYVPTTALAIMAMQDRRDHEAIGTSLAWLKAHATSEPSAMALSMAALGLEVAGESSEPARAALLQHTPGARAFGNLHLLAMTLYALGAKEHGARAFRLS